MFGSRLRTICTIAVFGVYALTAGTADACPSCKNANATDSRLPLAYQASILFMLAVPTTLVSILGVMLYRLNKAQVLATEAFENGDVWLGHPEFGASA
ncbi:MAG: hypothetical protein JWM11_6865 [Planctomycetaceae bacterium]|nr:hypothetical protein [Planctomycetaceae bacterium]